MKRAAGQLQPSTFTAVPIDGPPQNARRISGPLASLFTAPGKLLVVYQDAKHVYVRWGRNKWARVEMPGGKSA